MSYNHHCHDDCCCSKFCCCTGPTGPAGSDASISPAAAVADAICLDEMTGRFNQLLANLRDAGFLSI